MRRTIALLSLAAFALAACSGAEKPADAASAAAPSGTVTLERTACFGFCPMFKATVTGDEKLVFEGERFVAAEGAHEKTLPAGSFAKLVDIARSHGLAEFDASYPNEEGTNCPQMATDLPGVNVSVETADLTHSVHLDGGCMGFEGRDRFDAMVEEMEDVMAIDDWIGPREQFMGGTKDGN